MKLSIIDIKNFIHSRVFSAAMDLIMDGSVKVSNLIKASSGGENVTYYMDYDDYYIIFRVSITVNKEKEIISYQCGCLSYTKYTTFCKHIVALIMIAIKYEDESAFERELKIVESEKVYRENKIKMTSFIEKFKENSISRELINIRPIISYTIDYGGRTTYFLKLKVGTLREYIVKDIDEFCRAVLNSEIQSYGKLSFNHNINSFSEDSAKLIRTILKANMTFYGVNREAKISTVLFDEIIELHIGKFIEILTASESRFLVSDLETKLEITIKDNKLVFSDNSLMLAGFDYYYILKDGMIIRSKKEQNQRLAFIHQHLYQKKALDFTGAEEEFVNNIYPYINKHMVIPTDFMQKHPVLNLIIDTYFNLINGEIICTNLMYINDKPAEIITDPYFLKIIKRYENELINFGFIFELGRFIIKDLTLTLNFLTADINTLKEYGNVYLSEDIKKLSVKKLPKTSISVSYNVNLLEFEIVNDELTLEEIKNVLIAYHKKEKYFRLKDSSIIELDNETKKVADLFSEYGFDFKENIQQKPVNHLLKLLNEEYPHFNIDEKVKMILDDLANYKTANFLIPESLISVLRDYQKEAFNWLKTLIKYNFGGILADDMGLGKTIEIISVLMSDEQQKPSMIVCPTSLIYNWCNEFNKWHSNIKTIPVIGTSDARHQIIGNIKDDEKTVYVTSYDTLRRDYDFYKNTFRFIITDEAQFIKNQYAKKSNAVKKLKSEVNFSLTGTPIENSLADLWSIFDFVMPNYLSDYQSFRSRYETLIMADDKEALSSLVKKVTPFILRRTKKDVLKELPDKLESVYYVKMNDEQQKLYDAYYIKTMADLAVQDNKIIILSLLTRLRQICVDPSLFISNYNAGSAKVDITVDLINESINNDHKILVFSQFTSIFEILKERLTIENVGHLVLTGETKSRQRIELVDKFNTDEEIKVFLISLKAGGTGLNLTSADVVIHLDPWWNLSAENQATDRAHRIGQTKKVEVIKIICANTIEQRVLELQAAKKELADSIIGDEQSISKLSGEDIKLLLS